MSVVLKHPSIGISFGPHLEINVQSVVRSVWYDMDLTSEKHTNKNIEGRCNTINKKF